LAEASDKPKVTHRTADKWVKISSPAPVMRFHLKRFVWCGVKRHKVHTAVHFPFSLDLGEFVRRDGEGESDGGTGAAAASSSAGGGAAEKAEPLPLNYDLAAIICHQGASTQSGERHQEMILSEQSVLT
jgi:hypothetical protein